MADEKDLIDRQQALDVLQKMIDKRCGCSRTSIIEQRALQMAQEVIRQCPRIECHESRGSLL